MSSSWDMQPFASSGPYPPELMTVHGPMFLKHALTGASDKVVIEEVERGKDYIKSKFEATLQDTRLDSSTSAAIRTAYSSIRAGHDRASSLKHGVA